jgi:hypothetical protein
MSQIEVEGRRYKVIETLPFHGCGMKTKVVNTPRGERVAVCRDGKWTWWTAQDRLGSKWIPGGETP